MTERPSKHARRRRDPPDDLGARARSRLQRLGSPSVASVSVRPASVLPESIGAPAGWVPSTPAPSPPPAALPVAGTPTRLAGVADRLPVGLRAAALAPSARALTGIAAVLSLGLLFGAWLSWQGRPASTPAPALERTPAPTSAAGTSASSVSPAPTLVVHVAGAVRTPGLVRLPPGSRVADALDAAGGPAKGAELASVNLARPLVDGEQLVVLAKGQGPPVAAPAPGPGTGTGGAGPGGAGVVDAVLDLNTATLEQLETLPGVGPVLAQRILDWRAEHGRFGSVDELREVSGIGDATFADLEARVRV